MLKFVKVTFLSVVAAVAGTILAFALKSIIEEIEMGRVPAAFENVRRMASETLHGVADKVGVK